MRREQKLVVMAQFNQRFCSMWMQDGQPRTYFMAPQAHHDPAGHSNDKTKPNRARSKASRSSQRQQQYKEKQNAAYAAAVAAVTATRATSYARSITTYMVDGELHDEHWIKQHHRHRQQHLARINKCPHHYYHDGHDHDGSPRQANWQVGPLALVLLRRLSDRMP